MDKAFSKLHVLCFHKVSEKDLSKHLTIFLAPEVRRGHVK
uniref:Uncharacterized protein n=1 Tax=Rhizophora mucronata TaxID=61149 RepID=A0A2P2NHX4_RHIMU